MITPANKSTYSTLHTTLNTQPGGIPGDFRKLAYHVVGELVSGMVNAMDITTTTTISITAYQVYAEFHQASLCSDSILCTTMFLSIIDKKE